jgi:single-strand DNA-binding protein
MWHTIIIAGNVGRDPEMRYTPSGQAVTSFSVGTDSSYTDSSGNRIKKTIWFRVSVWGKQAETCSQYLKKGSKVLVEGHLTADDKGNPKTFQRQDGTTSASFEISAQNVRFLSSKSEGTGGGEEIGGGGGDAGEEIPF